MYSPPLVRVVRRFFCILPGQGILIEGGWESHPRVCFPRAKKLFYREPVLGTQEEEARRKRPGRGVWVGKRSESTQGWSQSLPIALDDQCNGTDGFLPMNIRFLLTPITQTGHQKSYPSRSKGGPMFTMGLFAHQNDLKIPS